MNAPIKHLSSIQITPSYILGKVKKNFKEQINLKKSKKTRKREEKERKVMEGLLKLSFYKNQRSQRMNLQITVSL